MLGVLFVIYEHTADLFTPEAAFKWFMTFSLSQALIDDIWEVTSDYLGACSSSLVAFGSLFQVVHSVVVLSVVLLLVDHDGGYFNLPLCNYDNLPLDLASYDYDLHEPPNTTSIFLFSFLVLTVLKPWISQATTHWWRPIPPQVLQRERQPQIAPLHNLLMRLKTFPVPADLCLVKLTVKLDLGLVKIRKHRRAYCIQCAQFQIWEYNYILGIIFK